VPRSSGVWQWIKKMRGHWVIFPGRSRCFEFLPWHFWLGDRKGVQPIKTSAIHSQSFCTGISEVKDDNTAEPANRGSPGKHPVKWKQRWFIFIVYVLLDCTSSLISDTSCCHSWRIYLQMSCWRCTSWSRIKTGDITLRTTWKQSQCTTLL